jgi:hypothetical protein
VNTSRALTLFLPLVLLGFVFLALSTPTARAADPVIVRVKVGGATSGSCGGTWDSACDLQYALTSTVGVAELWVAAGTYKPTTGSDRAATFQLHDNIALYGGFAMTETQRSQRSITANVTTLSGDLGAPIGMIDNTYHVVTASGVANTAVLDGFTVAHGTADGSAPDDSGGGMYSLGGSPTVSNVTFSDDWAYYGGGMYNNNSSPTLTDITFLSNVGSTKGGGMYNEGGNSSLSNVVFTTNWSKSGGGMYNYNSNPTLSNVTFNDNSGGGGMSNDHSNPTLTNVTFSHNSATTVGGGMANVSSNPTLTNVGFYGNSAYHGAGGMSNSNGSPRLTNVIFSGNSAITGGAGGMGSGGSPILMNTIFISNTAGTSGGGMTNGTGSPILTNVTFTGNSAPNGGAMYNYIDWGAGNPTLTNVTFSGNSATNGGAIYNYANSPTARNSIFWGNTATTGSQIHNAASNPPTTAYIYDSIVQGGCPMDSTCSNIITADPRLGTLGNYGGSTQTFPLLPGSSAIDAGNDATCASVPTDQRGILRPQGAHCDIGAFESQGFTLTKTSGDNQSTLVNAEFAMPLGLMVSSASGEPVNGGVVNFTAPSSGASAIPVSSAMTIASGAVSRILAANGTVGSYTVTATTAGAVAPAKFTLMNSLLNYSYLPLLSR